MIWWGTRSGAEGVKLDAQKITAVAGGGVQGAHRAPMRKPNKRLLAVAYHEGGHAVMYWHFGVPLKRVIIILQDDSKGVCCPARSLLRSKNRKLNTSARCMPNIEKEVIILFAGVIAQRIHRKSSFRSCHFDPDWCEAMKVAVSVNGPGEIATAWLHWLYLRAHKAVKFLWPQITAVAEALLEKRILSGEEVDDICVKVATAGQAHFFVTPEPSKEILDVGIVTPEPSSQ